jgi:hypothetical protein
MRYQDGRKMGGQGREGGSPVEGNSDDVEGSVPKFGLAAARWVLGRLRRQNSNQTERPPDRESLVRPSTTGSCHPRIAPLASTTKSFHKCELDKRYSRHVQCFPHGLGWCHVHSADSREGGAPISQVVSDDPDSDGPAD